MKELKLIGGGGNSLKPSHNHGLRLFLECLDAWRHRGIVGYGNKNCHTEDNCPKYRMVGKKVLSLGGHKFEPVKPCEPCETACRMAELERGCNDVYNTMLEPLTRISNAHIHSQRTAPSPRWSDVKGSNFSDKVYSLFTTRHSLKSAAFTLAEVLVTLGIIGVVSAMTVPTLMQNYQRQSYVTQLHKVYNELSQALVRYQNDQNAVNLTEAGLTSDAAFVSFINTYFKKAKECDTMNSCFATSYRKLSGATMGDYDRNNSSFVLASGATLRTGYSPEGAKLFNIALDINGPKGPNIVGRDLFWIYIYNNGVIDEGQIDANTTAPLTTAQREMRYQNGCGNPDNDSGGGCFGKILNDNWQMTY